MINLSAGEFEASAKYALSIAERLGEEIVVIGTSAGGGTGTLLGLQAS